MYWEGSRQDENGVYSDLLLLQWDEYFEIDSVWTSEKKAEKRCDELNEKGEKYLIEKCGCGLYEVRSEIVCT